ncbi:methylated-DNA--[protein]-cysteine S-methyltransferase [Halorussus salilacus]|uniref:methylated-DNA--[protein]-cysteine S-methyltransferase n=1 Tax=Halorussus salilacus TaxID=2953750 RepID=UPI00209EEBB1|nr:methylated-DNA--[protein]-cysteine S-methyltransferase [Halorussus salilacus]USZ67998.1 methylated-DNA--[protein]-cysteine S-methyltransferase [Halorussus salilacus]
MNVEVRGHEFDIEAERIDAPGDEIREQIREYAAGDRRAFDLPVAVPDDFTGEVMVAMRSIPYGETRTYGELAGQLNTAPVAVGGACGRNPVPIVVPCHRVVGAGSLGGYSASGGLDAKERLLALEGALD